MSEHEPTIYRAGRHGSWAVCRCGWSSETYGGQQGAQLAFGRHLLTGEHISRVGAR